MTVTKIEQQSLFDYDSLDSDTRAFVQEKAQAIHARLKRTAEDIIAIGQDLIAVNEKLARIHKFLPWLRQEFDMTRQTAYRFMAVAKKFGNCNIMLQFSPTDLYNLLEAPDTIIEQVESGQISPTLTAIQKAKQQAQIDADKEQDAATIAPIEIFPGWKISQTNEDIPLPATWNHVNGKPFDMPLPDGKPVEVPEEWKLPPEMRANSQAGGDKETEEERYMAAVDMGTTDLYYDNLRREAVQREKEKHDTHVMRVMGSSESPEWYTPQEIVRLVIEFLGEIDLDPCSNSREMPNVPARTLYTKEDDGLSQEWNGRTYLNPPYGSEIPQWIEKLVASYNSYGVSEALALLPARIDTQWFQPLYAFPMCNVRGRLQFENASNSAPFPSVIVYLGDRVDDFIRVFGQKGPIVRRIG